MAYIAPLPRAVQGKLGENTHPGLALDKYVTSWDEHSHETGKLSEKVQKDAILKVVQLTKCAPESLGLDFIALKERRGAVFNALGASGFKCLNTGPLTLHLARASALENAGVCLHHVYGFTYLPGSGLKGMARAYAETIWLPGQPDRQEAGRRIREVFGNPPGNSEAQAGMVVFHDAWPDEWPRLRTDILNSHHAKYYQGEDYPGDWEEPIPVYFLSLAPGTLFSFALSPRQARCEALALDLAKQWLLGGLCHLGAGAKTASGYGSFQPLQEEIPALASGALVEFKTEVHLITPAFLAGAEQQAAECELRPSTVRGLLRWWWRTMHAGHVNRETLLKLEALIWGDTKAGGAVRLVVEPISPLPANKYDKRAIQTSSGLETSKDKKTSQGLFYASYGMADGNRDPRHYASPGEKWSIRLVARKAQFDAKSIAPEALLPQAQAALWLLCKFGGVGAKSRKGFGSLSGKVPGFSLDVCKAVAKQFRDGCGIQSKLASEPATAALEAILQTSDIQTPWKDVWYAMDQLGYSIQNFAQKYKHNLQKKALGLPRNIGRPVTGIFSSPIRDRHASPVHFHWTPSEDGAHSLKGTAFPASRLPTFQLSKAFLLEFLEHIKADMESRAKDFARKGQHPTSDPPRPGQQTAPPAHVPRPDTTLRNGSWVDAVLVEDPKGKGRPFAKHPRVVAPGIVNGDPEPSDKTIGDTVKLVIVSVSANGKDISFRWPKPGETPSQTQDRRPNTSPHRGGGSQHGGGHGGGRR